MNTKARYIVYAVVLVAIILPVVFNFSLTHSPSPETTRFHALIDSLPAGATILISFDFEASSFAEIRPLADAMIQHAFRKDIRIVALSLFAEGAALGEEVLAANAKTAGKIYGRDYAFLGFRPQYQSAILALGESISGEFPVDYYGSPSSELPLLGESDSYEKLALVVSIADGSMPTYWVEYAVTRHHVRLACLLSATMATQFYPYLSSQQIIAFASGLKGAAEYEDLLKLPGAGGRGLFAQSIAQFAIVAIIIAGNVVERLRRRN
jgi:hypothetical protein